MSFRLSILGIFLILFLLVLLSNNQNIMLQFFFLKIEVPLFFAIAGGCAYGILLSIVFFSFKSYDRKMKNKLFKFKKLSEKKSEKK